MQIIAKVFVSMSEIAKVLPDITYDWIDDNENEFKQMLWELGVDNQKYSVEVQEDVIHRNRLNEVVQCRRWVGEERTDKEWLNSGYASREAVDKAKGSRLLVDLYRMRGAAE